MEITNILLADGIGSMLARPEILMLVGMFALMYFLIFRPQRKQREEQEKLKSSLKAGDKIVTIGGIHGIIERVNKDTIHILTADKTLIEFSTDSVNRRVEATSASNDKKDKK